MSELEIYADYLSQPSRTLIIFCRMANIPFTFKEIRMMKGENKTQEFFDKVN